MIKKIITLVLIALLSALNLTIAFGSKVEKERLTEKKVVNNQVLITSSKIYDKGEYVSMEIESFIISPKDNMTVKESFSKPEGATLSFDIIYNADKTYTVIEDALVGQIALYDADKFKFSEFYIDNSYEYIVQGNTVYVAIPSKKDFFLDDLEILEKFNLARKNLFQLIQPYELNFKDNTFTGLFAPYDFVIPDNMDFKIYNNTYSDTTGAVEKIDFVLKTEATTDKAFVLFELLVYNLEDFENITGVFKLGETEDFVYGVKINGENDYITIKSKAQFENALEDIKADNFQLLKDSLNIPVSAASALEALKEKNKIQVTQVVQDVAPSNHLFVNGNKTDITYTVNEEQIYFPVRKTLETIGFQIGWDEESKSISFTNNELSGLFKVDSNEYFINDNVIKLQKSIVLIDEISYLPVDFFAGVMPYHYVVRDNGAVYLILE